VGQVEALAVLVQAHQHRHVARRHAADAQMHGVDQAVQAVGGVQFAADQFVAQVAQDA
jgi:alkylation response protein AidB-like acyl-CoA dehydrogenase